MRNSVPRLARRLARFACAIESMESRLLLSNTIADWTFETIQPSNAGPVTPEIGSGTGTTFHAGASTYSSVTGNGSTKSWSSNTWAVGDYYQFKVNTAGLGSIGFQWDQTSSNTGPKNFQVEYSTDGTSFTNYTGAFSTGTATAGVTTVLANASPNVAWTSTSVNSAYTFTIDLSAISAINNQANVYFRIADQTTVSAAGGTVATTGTDRIDNVIVVGTPIAVPVIASVSVNPPSVVVNSGTTVNLTANNVTDTGPSVTGVSFYVNSYNPASPSTNLLPGTAVNDGSGNWTLSGVSTTGLPTGNTTYIAVAVDALSALSAPVSTTLAVLGTTQVSFSSPTYTVNEAAGTATITVSRTGDLSGTTTVQYATSDGAHFTTANPQFDGAAVAGVDYTATSGMLTFGPTISSQPITVPIADIKTFSTYSDASTPVTRTFNLSLSGVTGANATLGLNGGTATETISENTVTAPAPGIDTPTGSTTATYDATATAGGGTTNGTIPLAVASHGSFNGTQMPEIEFGAGSTVFPNTYAAAAIDSIRLSLFNIAITGSGSGTPGLFDAYLLTTDSVAATSLTYKGTAPSTGPGVLGTPPEAGAILIGTAAFTNNVAGYNDYTFDNLSAPVQTALVNYFNGGGSAPIRFVLIPHLGATNFAADWAGNSAAFPAEVPKLQLLVEKSNNVIENYSISEAGSNTPLGTINKGDGSNDNDSMTFYVTRTGNAALGFDSDSSTVPYTLTGPDVNGIDYILSGPNAPATSTGTTGTFTFAAGVDQVSLDVTTIGAQNSANISPDRTFSLKLGTPVPTGSMHVGLLGSPNSAVVTVHDARTLDVSSTNSSTATTTPSDIATILQPGPGTAVGGPRTGTNGVAQWQEEGTGANTATANFASYAIANFNDSVTDPSDVFTLPSPIGSINSITLSTVSSGSNTFDAAGPVDVYLVATPAAFSSLTFNPADPGGLDPSQLTVLGLLGTFVSNPSQSAGAYTNFPLTQGSSVLSTLANDLNNSLEFTIVLAPHNTSSAEAMSWVGNVVGGLPVNGPTLSFNYTAVGVATPANSNPPWLSDATTNGTWSIYGNSLVVHGPDSITSDPGGDDPIITETTSAAVTSIPATAGNTIHIGGVNLTGGSKVTLASVTSGRTATNHRVLVVAGTGSFAIDSTSKLDLMDNDALFLGGTLSTVNNSLTSGFNGSGAWWTGGGIISSVAAATPALKTLGVESNDNGQGSSLRTIFDGQVTSDGDVLVKYTYVGDADLSGTLTAADYVAIDNGFNMALTGYANGNFNYDGASMATTTL